MLPHFDEPRNAILVFRYLYNVAQDSQLSLAFGQRDHHHHLLTRKGNGS
jgi:hypothetical protein